MPNPTIHQPDPPPERPPSSNGILAYVGGVSVAAGAEMLPRAAAGQPAELSVVLEVPELGLTRITYRLNSYTHGRRGRFWHWRAVFAERVGK